MQATQGGVDSKLYKTIVTIVDKRVKEIKVTRKDFDRVEDRLTRIEVVVEELAEAQKRTEHEIRELTISHKKLQKEIGGL
ncbi:MAG: hypothetical protein AABZ28_00760 [Nitrospinota bacterium]